MAPGSVSIFPGHGLGPIDLGASLRNVLTCMKEEKEQYPAIELHHSAADSLLAPVVVALPLNGIRLRFDGPDQRLRLIEIMDFRKIRLAYKGSELVKGPEDGVPTDSVPAFKRIYQIFGASYPGEYHPPMKGGQTGSYVLSWTGVAFRFPLQHAAYAPQKDHVAMLGSSAAGAATQMAVFEGNSWLEARKDLYAKTPAMPRLPAVASRPKDSLPAEVEFATVRGNGAIQLQRRAPTRPFVIMLNQTTSQDLITELGSPDAFHKRELETAAFDQTYRARTNGVSAPAINGRAPGGSQPSSYSSTGTDTFDADFDSGDAEDDTCDRAARETFWCYFEHGLDILVGPSSEHGPASTRHVQPAPSRQLVVTKVVIHGNVPGSYAFNRHRRLRWILDLPNVSAAAGLSSEANFTSHLKPKLLKAFEGMWPAADMGRGKVVNRTWEGSPSDSSFFLPDKDEDFTDGAGSESWVGNTRLFSFPGLVFEVLEGGAVGGLTIC